MKAVQAVLHAPRRFELVDQELSPGDGQALVQIAACGICSSEIPVFTGEMRREPPVVLGHEASGVVLQVGRGVTGLREGDRVTGAIHRGFASHAVVDADWLFPVPAQVPLKHALGEPLMCVANAARAAGPAFGDHVAVVGCGAMGLLTIAALKSPTLASLIALDLLDARLALARVCGATATVNVARDDAVAVVRDLTGAGADVVVEFTGTPKGLALATELLQVRQGKLIMGGYHHTPATYDLAGFARKGLIAHNAHPSYSPDIKA
ncbi:MAG: alcohol dehydrogenase catalytic domain-containing protein, partial [Actinobacteria bacterium]|nr:alcohol dehydrogenase catalytic domain-containing protein [Actinomycetota bacterium]